MKVQCYKKFLELCPSEQQKIQELYKQDVEDETNKYFAKLQKNWLMFSCIVLANYMGKSAEECLLYLANWRDVYRINSKINGDSEQQKWLLNEMDKIFGAGNYPYEYIDKLEEM